MKNIKDMRKVDWNYGTNFTGTRGCYMKAKIEENGKIMYYKLSNFNSVDGFVGHESINEVIAGRLGKMLGLNVNYQYLRKAIVNIKQKEYITYVCESFSYKKNNESRMSIEELCNTFRKDSESNLDVIKRLGLSGLIDRVIAFDFLIIGRDRHGSNIEVFWDMKNKKFIEAPIFDNGISLLAPITYDIPHEERIEKIREFKELGTYIGNNYIGSRNLTENLKNISKPIYVNKLKREDKKRIFYGLREALDNEYIEKIWSIIVYRYSYLRKVGIFIER